MSTDKVPGLLHTVNPDLFNLAEVVGKWIWIQFQYGPSGPQDIGRWRCHQQLRGWVSNGTAGGRHGGTRAEPSVLKR